MTDDALLNKSWLVIKDNSLEELYLMLKIISDRISATKKKQQENSDEFTRFINIYSRIVVQDEASKKSAPAYAPGEEMDINKIQAEVKAAVGKEKDISEGQKLFNAFALEFRPTICSSRGVLGILYKGTVDLEKLPQLIASHIIKNYLSPQSFWNLLALVIGYILNKIGVEEFCQ